MGLPTLKQYKAIKLSGSVDSKALARKRWAWAYRRVIIHNMVNKFRARYGMVLLPGINRGDVNLHMFIVPEVANKDPNRDIRIARLKLMASTEGSARILLPELNRSASRKLSSRGGNEQPELSVGKNSIRKKDGEKSTRQKSVRIPPNKDKDLNNAIVRPSSARTLV
jgi:hypothetical protein